MNTKLLLEILSQPTAPFRERHVVTLISTRLREAKIPHFLDPVGNLVIGVGSAPEYLAKLKVKTNDPVRLFIAHMDHPGFHGVHWISSRELHTRWYGGSPSKHLNGAKVWLADASGWLAEGEFSKIKLTASKHSLDTASIRFKKPVRIDAFAAESIFGGFRFGAPVWQKGELIYTKAADDLVGAYVIANLAIELKRLKKLGFAFIGILTRAEEVGFIGAIGHFELGWLEQARRPILGISLETSRTLPGALIGKGPVVRLGDNASLFDSGSLKLFSKLARQVLPERHQRRIMDGGVCEATVVMAWGYPAIGISIPLGNYHNQSFEGGPDSRGKLGPAPEFVHFKDILGMSTLCRALLDPSIPWKTPWAETKARLQKRKAGYSGLLKTQ